MKSLLLLIPILFSAVSLNAHDVKDVQDDIKVNEVVWVDPDLLSWAETVYPGTQITNVFGNPKEPGKMYAIRFRLPANYVVKPHTHSQDEYMTVISGSLNVGIGSIVNKDETTYLPLGGAVGIPGGVPHYAWTTEEMIMQVHAMGPRDTTFCNQD